KVRGERSGPLATVLPDTLEDAADAAPRQAGKIGSVGGEAEHEIRMILQVLADAWQVMHAGDAMSAEGSGVADARQHQQFRRLERAGGEDDLAPCAKLLLLLPLHVFDGDGALALEQDARGLRPRFDAQVLTLAHERVDIAARRAPALAIVLRHLVDAEAFLLGAVKVVADAKLRLARALQEHLL